MCRMKVPIHLKSPMFLTTPSHFPSTNSMLKNMRENLEQGQGNRQHGVPMDGDLSNFKVHQDTILPLNRSLVIRRNWNHCASGRLNQTSGLKMGRMGAEAPVNHTTPPLIIFSVASLGRLLVSFLTIHYCQGYHKAIYRGAPSSSHIVYFNHRRLSA